MKKFFKLLGVTIGLLLVGLIIMAIFKICPPQGPWIMPPWCEAKVMEDVDSIFLPKDISYIPENLNYVEKKGFVFGVGMMDLWGKLCTNPFFCDDPKKYVDTSFDRLKQLNSELVMVTDFYQIDRNKNILDVTMGGARTISPKDMSFLIEDAHSHNLKFMLMTNLYEKDHSREILNMDNPSFDEIDHLFDEWKEKILVEAGKGNYDYFIINPRDIGFFFDNKQDNDYINQKLVKLLPEIRKNYTGNICLWGFLGTIGNYANNYDCVIVDQGIKSLFKNTSENLSNIVKRWKLYLGNIHYNVPTFVLILMPSYDGAMQNGWVEPVGIKYKSGEYILDQKEQALIYEGFFRAVKDYPQIDGVISYGYWWNDKVYPNTLDIFRNDISHSIRDKDAESVFYSRSKR